LIKRIENVGSTAVPGLPAKPVIDILVEEHTREKKKQMRRFKSLQQAQRFLSMHGPIQNLLRVGRYHLKAVHYRFVQEQAFYDWRRFIFIGSQKL
jgi:GrpB-like predicted nucleotidyltransferase (UPF0157 family)